MRKHDLPSRPLGHVIVVGNAWIAKVTEEAPNPRCRSSTRTILWRRPGNDYLFHDLLADTPAAHDIEAAVFVDCHSMYRKEGPAELRYVGETECANGVAAMSASGMYGDLCAFAAIVSHVDLRLGARDVA